jgi:hypothetical protein
LPPLCLCGVVYLDVKLNSDGRLPSYVAVHKKAGSRASMPVLIDGSDRSVCACVEKRKVVLP